jgi:hypothetical protein
MEFSLIDKEEVSYLSYLMNYHFKSCNYEILANIIKMSPCTAIDIIFVLIFVKYAKRGFNSNLKIDFSEYQFSKILIAFFCQGISPEQIAKELL